MEAMKCDMVSGCKSSSATRDSDNPFVKRGLYQVAEKRIQLFQAASKSVSLVTLIIIEDISYCNECDTEVYTICTVEMIAYCDCWMR